MKLYYSKGACSLSVRIIIHEIGIQSDFEAVDLKTKKTETGEDYLKINPKGAVPAVRLDNQEILTENSAIQQYLADTHHSPLLPPLGDFKRYRVIELTSFITSDLHKNFSPIFRSDFGDDLKNIFKHIIESKLLILDKGLGNKTFLMGDQFTLPDAYLFVILRWAYNYKLKVPENLDRYFNNLKERPSVAQSLKEEDLK